MSEQDCSTIIALALQVERLEAKVAEQAATIAKLEGATQSAINSAKRRGETVKEQAATIKRLTNTLKWVKNWITSTPWVYKSESDRAILRRIDEALNPASQKEQPNADSRD